MRNIYIVMGADDESSWPARAYTNKKKADKERDLLIRTMSQWQKAYHTQFWVESLKVNENE